jgi:hypothetical protein
LKNMMITLKSMGLTFINHLLRSQLTLMTITLPYTTQAVQVEDARSCFVRLGTGPQSSTLKLMKYDEMDRIYVS